MGDPPVLIFRARTILPIASPSIEDGAIVIQGARILTAGRWADLRVHWTGEPLDLGERVVLPGLINGHCHLDYTSMAGELPATRHFTDWIKAITAAKAGKTYSDFAESWVSGARMLLDHGTTMVGDIEAVPELLPDIWDSTPLRIVSFLEMTGVRSRRVPAEVLGEALARVEGPGHSRSRMGLSPHAPYSTTPGLLQLTALAARERRLPLSMHVAESAEEFDMFRHGRGPLFDWLHRQRDMSDCGGRSPVQHLAGNGMLGPDLCAVHVNHLDAGDAALLGENGVSVVHCPRSHEFFGHRRFPLEELTAAGVNVGLGTDSLASVRKMRAKPMELDLFSEMRALASREPGLSPSNVLRMATLNGAHALGMSGRAGVLSEGACADLIAVPFSGAAIEAEAAVVHHAGRVDASMIDGRWAIEPAAI
jgi:cytosine/adenosine deaminase-related metal-dependent hydrolase